MFYLCNGINSLLYAQFLIGVMSERGKKEASLYQQALALCYYS